jgi:hypothetical protein
MIDLLLDTDHLADLLSVRHDKRAGARVNEPRPGQEG